WRVELIQVEDPTRRRKLWRPHHVKLQDVGIGRTRVQPLDVELVTIVGGVWRRAQFDAYRRMHRVKAIQLTADGVGLRANRTAGKHEDVRILPHTTAGAEGRYHSHDRHPGTMRHRVDREGTTRGRAKHLGI